MRKFISILFVVISLVCLAILNGCGHKHKDDIVAPTLTISKPLEGDTVSGNVRIVFTTADNTDLHECRVTLSGNGNTLYSDAPYVHELVTFSYDKTVAPNTPITAPTSATLTVSSVDHNNNRVSKSVNFILKP